MTRNVADAAALLSVLVGTDANDPATSQASKGEKDYTKFLQHGRLEGNADRRRTTILRP